MDSTLGLEAEHINYEQFDASLGQEKKQAHVLFRGLSHLLIDSGPMAMDFTPNLKPKS